ncbi:glycine oxidase ThiO [Thermomicrobium sp. 4228-Ro]|uniref:glycine oxidase ThiO n=1 Tax=Thermomicrobium sp. 4228-Ro TaxID=2993937 RepID=UPI0022499B15|nr:glycine oxidase ThiO [Thermomicrobium sp. 4228-Ro]MCX2727166.1 glycine oxidase ThiO [Thermomicrobium sp. 4228-Ro]
MTRKLEPYPDVIVVGGGVIGATIAYALSRRGQRVVLLEREAVGEGTSLASAGIVSPLDQRQYLPELVQLLWRSIRSYPWLVGTLEEETGLSVGYRQWGSLLVAETDDEVATLREVGHWLDAVGFTVEWLDGPAAREAEPLLPVHIQGGLLIEDGASVLVPQLVRAAVAAAQRRGATVYEHTAVTALEAAGDRVVAVHTVHERLPTSAVVLAAGAWTGQLVAPLGVSLPTVPVKGQMALVEGSTARPRHILGGPSVASYVVPRVDGLIWIGTTVERGRWGTRPTPQGLWQCIDTARRVAPALLHEEIVAVGAGLRPGTADDLPALGRLPGWRNLWVATGHLRLGIMLAPVTADLVAEAIEQESEAVFPPAFSPRRFAGATGTA